MDKNESLAEVGIASEKIYDGKIIKVFRDTVRLPDGKEALREVVRHPGAVCVVPVTDEGEILCVKQFRYPFSEITTEIPAGKLDHPGEDHASAARRELLEETGASCSGLRFIGELYTSLAILDEVIYMYLATGLSFGETHFDDDEFIEPARIPFAKMKEMILSGEIKDAKTQAAVLKAALMLGY